MSLLRNLVSASPYTWCTLRDVTRGGFESPCPRVGEEEGVGKIGNSWSNRDGTGTGCAMKSERYGVRWRGRVRESPSDVW